MTKTSKTPAKKRSLKKATTAPHIIIEAGAGCGKSSTMIEGLKYILGQQPAFEPSEQQQAIWDAMKQGPKPSTANFVSFSKALQRENESKVPSPFTAMTMHSMGFKAVRSRFSIMGGTRGCNGWRTKNHLEELTGRTSWDMSREEPELINGCDSLVGLCKANLIDGTDPEELDRLASHYGVELNGSRSQVFEYVPQLLERAKDVDRDRYIDFNDMIWLPVILDIPVEQYDLLLYDEFQDSNLCQQALASKAGRRLILCGDRNQAIFGFTGADATAMDRYKAVLEESNQGCESYPLTVTRRCGKAIVAEAQKIVPNFFAHDSNGEGTISQAVFDSKATVNYRHSVQDRDMLLCRVNAPLVSECFRFLKSGRKANIAGRDVGQGLIALIKKLFKAEGKMHGVVRAKDWDEVYPKLSVTDLVPRIEEWRELEVSKETKKRNSSEMRINSINDKADCLQFFCEDMKHVGEVVDHINYIFTDETTDGILLSSIHKAKGLEADRVFLLEPQGATVPHPMAKQSWELQQEWNLRYTAITRAKELLVYVR